MVAYQRTVGIENLCETDTDMCIIWLLVECPSCHRLSGARLHGNVSIEGEI